MNIPNSLKSYKYPDRPIAKPGYQNVKLVFSFNGQGLNGYQYQPHGVTIQGLVQEAWAILTGEKVSLMGCSRLDAGVHAKKYVCNFHASCLGRFTPPKILTALNGIMKHTLKQLIAFEECIEVSPDFHARFDSSGKHYQYLLWHGRAENIWLTPHCWNLKSQVPFLPHVPFQNMVLGTHNFSAFRASDCTSRNPTKTIWKFDVSAHPHHPECTIVDVEGSGFLKNMVRNMVGTLVDLGTQKLVWEEVHAAFVQGNRMAMGQCAPAHGLSLINVFYPDSLFHTL